MEIETIKTHIDFVSRALINSLPEQGEIPLESKRTIIARYTAVLEGNFIAWMTAAHISVSSPIAKSIIHANLTEELKDNHPGMLRNFAVAANAIPDIMDYNAVHGVVTEVRKLVSELCGIKLLIMMAFFESVIANFMPYLAQLAAASGSKDFQYTSVHATADVAHTQGLYQAIANEFPLNQNRTKSPDELFEGITKIRDLILTITANS